MPLSNKTGLWFDRRPLVALAPMEAVTDAAYRPVVRSIAPDAVLYTEFAPARGLLHLAPRVLQMVEFGELERPLVVQLYDNSPEALGKAAALVVQRNRPDGIDLNMGCPVRKVAARGAGCGMMAFPEVAAESVRQMVEHADGVPVSIKTRLGIHDKSQVVEVVQACLEAGARQVTIHARLKADRPRIPADWNALAAAVEQISAPVIGNGDVWSEFDALRMVKETGVAGVMIGRGGIGNPWLLKRCSQALAGQAVDDLPSRAERARVALMHLQANVAMKGERRGVLEMRKVIRNYIKGYRDSKSTWMRIIQSETELETAEILAAFGNTEAVETQDEPDSPQDWQTAG